MNQQTIAQSQAEAIIESDYKSIDLTDWVFTLTSSEYRACSKAHIAAGSSRSPEGKRMSINIEHVGNLLIQHYIEDVAERNHCRLVSLSDSIGPTINDSVKVKVVWQFKVAPIDERQTKFTNFVAVESTDAYFEALQKRGISFDQASKAAQAAVSAHNAEETPLFAMDIGRKVREGRWPLTAVSQK